MKFIPLVLASLWRKPARTIFTFLSVMVAFVLFGMLSSLDRGIAHHLEVSRLDRLFVDPLSGSLMPISYMQRIAEVPGVRIVAPRRRLGGYVADPKISVAINGTNADFLRARPEITASQEDIKRLFSTRTGALVGTYYVRRYNWKVGDRIPVTTNVAQKDGNKTWTFDVLAIVDDLDHPGNAGYFLADYDYIDQGRASGGSQADRFIVRIDNPAHAAEIGKAIDNLFANSPAPTRTGSEKATAQTNMQSLGDIGYFTRALILSVLVALLFLTGNTMMQSIRERTPELGLLKTLGFSDAAVLVLVVAEALLLCTLAGATGLGVVWLAFPKIKHDVPNFSYLLDFPFSAIAPGLLYALGVGVISAAIPALRASRLKLVDALRQ